MSRFIKWALLALVAVVVISIGAAIAVVALVDPDDYRDVIAEAVEAQTGRQLTIDGKLSLSLFPCCGIDIGASRLSNPPDFPAGDFAVFEQAGLRIKVWPLLTRQELIIGSVRVDRLSLSLIERDASSNNWTFEALEADETDGSNDDPSGDEPMPQLSIDEILVRDAQLSYEHLTTGQRLSVSNVRFETGPVVPGDPIRFELELSGRDDSQDIEGALELGGIGLLDLDAQTLALTDVSGGIEVVDLVTVRPLALGTLTYALDSGDLRIDQSTAQINYQGVSANLSAAGQLVGEALTGSGNVDIGKFSPRKLLESLDSELATTDPDALSAAEASFEFMLSPDAISISQLTGVLDDTRINGTVSVAGFDAPAVELQLKVDEIDLDRYLAPADQSVRSATSSGDATTGDEALPEALRDLTVRGELGVGRLGVAGLTISDFSAAARLAGDQLTGSGRFDIEKFSPRKLLASQGTEVTTADPDVLSNAEASVAFALSPDTISISELNAVLDDTRITGTASIADFDTPAVTIRLNVDEIDLDRYLAPADESGGPAATSGDAPGDDDLPLESLRELNVRGDLGIDTLRVVGLTLSDFSTALNARNGDIRLDPIRLALYGGSLAGDLRLDATSDTAKLALQQSLQSVDAAAFLGDLTDATELQGTLSGTIALTSSGATQSALLDGLGGQFDGRLDDGVYEGVDLWHEIGVARALIRRKSPPPAPDAPRTPINEMSVNCTIVGEVVNFDRLVAEIPFLRLSGQGSIDTASQNLQLKFDGNVLEAPELENGEVLSDLKGLTIPLTITGPADSPKVGVDLANLTKSVAEEKLREKLLKELEADEPPKEGEKESSGDVLRRGLRDLLKR